MQRIDDLAGNPAMNKPKRSLQRKARVLSQKEREEHASDLRSSKMAKGHKCPVCGTQTLQPISTNRLKCSKCDSTFPKNVIVGS
ncbi:hypothetical protein ACFW96_38915 [Streptomyces gardneri]|uniref:hypothetical protein n=1 Tax=Streptomyces gardneri TaxID=66892 RepID=UPI0036B5BB50